MMKRNKMRDYQTLEKLEEKVFVLDNGNDEETINHEINTFFNEIVVRKKYDPFEGGLQGSMLVYPDKAGFKIAEKNGMAVHAHTEETLAQYLDGDTKFSSYESMRYPVRKIGDPHSAYVLEDHGFTCRILAGSDTLLLAFATRNNDISKFQLDVIEVCVKKAREMLSNNLFERTAIGYVTNEDRFLMLDRVFDITKEECYKELDNLEMLLQTRKEEIMRK